MENTSVKNFNQNLRDRTFAFAVEIHSILKTKKVIPLSRPMVNQLIRCSSSVAANCRAATRARSDAEYYSKTCIVAEECDETQFWLDYLVKTDTLSDSEFSAIRNESEELVKIFSTIKKKLKDKLQK